ncbi:hypothetical protein I553_0221 [Mycobacterium xenopi 4042]|uniref:Uncharacterized protein n=1 Tax=Mycobacterium xenopi 4042 TaxID=1299334 RepID=X7YKT4_MYCXE|nr:hypothetical protein I553_0221 [Mycobacterium xenopi 4042]
MNGRQIPPRPPVRAPSTSQRYLPGGGEAAAASKGARAAADAGEAATKASRGKQRSPMRRNPESR